MARVFKGKAFVVKDNMDTDQIIPAKHLALVPTIPEEYEKLGALAFDGLPSDYTIPFVKDGETKTEYPIIIGGKNFGCGSSREHAPICLGAAGSKTVIAESFARIFFRNCVATGELYPAETPARLCDEINTGDECEVDLDNNTLKANGKEYSLNPIGEIGPVIDVGGIFNFARENGMIKK